MHDSIVRVLTITSFASLQCFDSRHLTSKLLLSYLSCPAVQTFIDWLGFQWCIVSRDNLSKATVYAHRILQYLLGDHYSYYVKAYA